MLRSVNRQLHRVALGEVNSVNEKHTLPRGLASFHLEALPHKKERGVKRTQLGNSCPAVLQFAVDQHCRKDTETTTAVVLFSYLL